MGHDGVADLRDEMNRWPSGPLAPLYNDMLIIVTYDENGGYWDHVSPPGRDRWGAGTRTALIAIRPTIKRGFVDDTTYDFGSILKTIEEFDVDPLTEVDGKGASLRAMLR